MSYPYGAERARVAAVNEANLAGQKTFSLALSTTPGAISNVTVGLYLVSIISGTATTYVTLLVAASSGTTNFPSAAQFGSAGFTAAVFRGDVAQEVLEVPSGQQVVQAAISAGTGTLFITRLA